MESTTVSGITLFYDGGERSAADLLVDSCRRSAQLIHESWGFDTPSRLHVHVMTSWLGFFRHAPPWHWKILLLLLFPLWVFKTKKMWRFAGGWAQAFGRTRTVGVKPPRILAETDTTIGDRVFIREDDLDERTGRIACHELTHAFSSHLRLPVWLHEGIAMVTVDRFAGSPTVQLSTLGLLARADRKLNPRRYQNLPQVESDAFLYPFVRGYWITRFLEETRPGLLVRLFDRRRTHEELEQAIAAGLGKSLDEFWKEIDGLVTAHFGATETQGTADDDQDRTDSAGRDA